MQDGKPVGGRLASGQGVLSRLAAGGALVDVGRRVRGPFAIAARGNRCIALPGARRFVIKDSVQQTSKHWRYSFCVGFEDGGRKAGQFARCEETAASPRIEPLGSASPAVLRCDRIRWTFSQVRW